LTDTDAIVQRKYPEEEKEETNRDLSELRDFRRHFEFLHLCFELLELTRPHIVRLLLRPRYSHLTYLHVLFLSEYRYYDVWGVSKGIAINHDCEQKHLMDAHILYVPMLAASAYTASQSILRPSHSH